MKEFTNYILQFYNLNQQQIDFISNKAVHTEIPKDAFFLEAGKITRQVGFIVEGVLRIYFYNNKGEEITRYFFDENHLVLELKSFENNVPPSEYVQAITDCKLITFSRESWLEISHTIVGWENIVQKMISRNLFHKLERRGSLIEQDATTRYLTFIEKFPALANRVPLSYIASFLGITKSSLSRIRRNIR